MYRLIAWENKPESIPEGIGGVVPETREKVGETWPEKDRTRRIFKNKVFNLFWFVFNE